MSLFDPQLTHWAHPAVAVAALAAGILLVAWLVWALARFRRPPPCDEQGDAPIKG